MGSAHYHGGDEDDRRRRIHHRPSFIVHNTVVGDGGLDPGFDGQRASPGLGPGLAVDAHRRQGRAHARVAEAAVGRTESVAGPERLVVPVDGVDGRLVPGAGHRRRAGPVGNVRAPRESHGRVAHAVHHELVGRPPVQAHEQQQCDALKHTAECTLLFSIPTLVGIKRRVRR